MQWPDEPRGRLHRDARDSAREKCAILYEKHLGSTGNGIGEHLTVLGIELRSPGGEIPRFTPFEAHEGRRGRKSYQAIAEASQVLRGLTPEHASGRLFNVPRQKHRRALCVSKEGRAVTVFHQYVCEQDTHFGHETLPPKVGEKIVVEAWCGPLRIEAQLCPPGGPVSGNRSGACPTPGPDKPPRLFTPLLFETSYLAEQLNFAGIETGRPISYSSRGITIIVHPSRSSFLTLGLFFPMT